MRRLWLRWLGLLVFVAVLATVFVNLGEWQLRRLDERRARNDVVVAHESSPVVSLASTGYPQVHDEDQWQRVTLTGQFDASRQLQVRYRSNGDDQGTEILTPLRTDDGHLVLVSRGFISRKNDGEPSADSLPPPVGEVNVTGYLRRSEQGASVAITPAQGAIRLINAPALSTWLGAEAMDGYVMLISVTPAQTGPFRAFELPTLDEGPHFWYAVQWFMFCGFALVGLVVFVRSDLKVRRTLRAEAAAAAAGGPPGPGTDDPQTDPDHDEPTSSQDQRIAARP